MAKHPMVGRVGSVIRAIRGGSLAGEVRIVTEGIPHHLLAYCAEPLPIGTQILVIHDRGARQIDVEPWPPSRVAGDSHEEPERH